MVYEQCGHATPDVESCSYCAVTQKLLARARAAYSGPDPIAASRALWNDLDQYPKSPAPVVVDAPRVEPEAPRLSPWGLLGAAGMGLIACVAVWNGSPYAPVLVVCAVGAGAMVAFKKEDSHRE